VIDRRPRYTVEAWSMITHPVVPRVAAKPDPRQCPCRPGSNRRPIVT
jgi:hypothetical protein